MSTNVRSAPSRRRLSDAALRRARAQRRAVRRRRIGWALLATAVVAAVVVVTSGAFSTAVREITLPLKHEDVIRQQAQAKDLDPALIAAVIYTESRFSPRTSSAGAEGLMQITPETAQFIARTSGGTAFTLSDLATPQVNISYGAWYLRWLRQKYGGDDRLMLAAYNAGFGNVDRWLAAARAAGHPFGLGDIRFPETRAYVENVQELQREYRRNYASELGL